MGVFYLGLYRMSVGIGGLKSGASGYGSESRPIRRKRQEGEGSKGLLQQVLSSSSALEL